MKARRSRRPSSRTAAFAASPRDTDATTFSPILLDLLAHVPGAFGAVLVDCDGEAVDYAGRAAPYDLKLAGAHWQIVLRDLRTLAEASSLGAPRSIVVRGLKRSFIAHVLPDDYALVLLLSRRAGFSAAACAFAVCERALATEAGWRLDALSAPWFELQVVAGRGGRPARIRDGQGDHALIVLGRVSGLGSHGDAWRVRLDQGAELTLAREPGGHWYADEPIAFLGSPELSSLRLETAEICGNSPSGRRA